MKWVIGEFGSAIPIIVFAVLSLRDFLFKAPVNFRSGDKAGAEKITDAKAYNC